MGTLIRDRLLACVLAIVVIFTIICLINMVAACTRTGLVLRVAAGAVRRLEGSLFSGLRQLPMECFSSGPANRVVSHFAGSVSGVSVVVGGSLASVVRNTMALVNAFIFVVAAG